MIGFVYQVVCECFEYLVIIFVMCVLIGLVGDISVDGGGIYYVLLGFFYCFGVGWVIGGM